jgi:hypothetical protein
MSVKDLIAKWEDALAEAQLAMSPDELSDEDLEAAAVPGIVVKSGLGAGEARSEDFNCSAVFGDCFTWWWCE